MSDLWQERLDQATNGNDNSVFIPEIVTHRVTVLAKEGQEAITLIPETDYTYPMLRWVDRAKNFLFGIVAHRKKRKSDGSEYEDNHASFYFGNPEGGNNKTGMIDIEFGEEDPQMAIEELLVRLKKGGRIAIQSPGNRTFELKVDEDGNLFTERLTGLRADSEKIKEADNA